MRSFKLTLIALYLVSGCAGAGWDPQGGVPPVPSLLGVSTSEVGVGEPIEFYGGSFLGSGNSFRRGVGYAEVQFSGTYYLDGGGEEPIDMRFRPTWEDGNRLLLPFFGPYSIPFSSTGDKLGSFEGEIRVINIGDSGIEAASPPVPVSMRVKPSIIIRGFAPLESSCSKPSKVILGGFPYKITTEAIGFSPVNFTYVINGEPDPVTIHSTAPRILRQVAHGNTNTFGGNGELVFTPVPQPFPFYAIDFAVRAVGRDGIERSLLLGIGVHNPIEYINSGDFVLAERETPRPVSGTYCIFGGSAAGTPVSYNREWVESRTRTTSVEYNSTFIQSSSSDHMRGHTSGTNEADIMMDSAGGDSAWHWSAGGSATFTTGFLVKLLAGAEVTIQGEGGHNWSDNWNRQHTVQKDKSSQDTESWSDSKSESHQLSQGSSDGLSVTQSESSTLGLSWQLLPNNWGVVYRQATRLALPGSIIVYNLCGAPETVGRSYFYDFTWSVDFQQGPSCSPPPPSQLPPAQCFLGCGG